jgi:uncharacterized protein (TIGR02217 family)
MSISEGAISELAISESSSSAPPAVVVPFVPRLAIAVALQTTEADELIAPRRRAPLLAAAHYPRRPRVFNEPFDPEDDDAIVRLLAARHALVVHSGHMAAGHAAAAVYRTGHAGDAPPMAAGHVAAAVYRTGHAGDAPPMAAGHVAAAIWRSGQAGLQAAMAAGQIAAVIWRNAPYQTGPVGVPPPLFPPPLPPLLYAWPIKKRMQFHTRLQRSVNGRDFRLLDQPLPIWTWTLTFPVLRDQNDSRAASPYSYAELRDLMAAFLGGFGPYGLYGFDDVTDDKVAGQYLTTGDGLNSTYQAQRTMGSGAGSFTEPITLLNVVSALYYNGIDAGAFRYDVSTGLIYAAAAAPSGARVTADFTYYFRVRFTDDLQDFENLMLDLWQLKQCAIQSVIYP